MVTQGEMAKLAEALALNEMLKHPLVRMNLYRFDEMYITNYVQGKYAITDELKEEEEPLKTIREGYLNFIEYYMQIITNTLL